MKEGEFGKIRSAVEMHAEEAATKELLEKPKARHFEQAFEFFRAWQELDEEAAGNLISYFSTFKKIKEELGPDTYNLFNSVYQEKQNASLDDQRQGLRQIRGSSLSEEEMEKEALEFTKRSLKKIDSEVKNDERIQKLFAGKEELLEKTLETADIEAEKFLDALI